jgi:hypothetical protein
LNGISASGRLGLVFVSVNRHPVFSSV